MQHHTEDCFKGVIAEGKSTGSVEKFAGVDAYFAKPKGQKPKSAVIIATDIFGHTFVNAQLIADSITSSTDFLCVVPDLFAGDTLSPGLDFANENTRKTVFGPWMAKHSPPDSKMPILRNVIKELKEKEGIEKIGMVGYCFGGRLAALFAAEDGTTTASVVAHPSKMTLPNEIEEIKTPTLWICAEIDSSFGEQDRKATEDILQKKKLKAIFKLYPGTNHGFASRGDVKNEIVQAAKKEALKETIMFFEEQLK